MRKIFLLSLITLFSALLFSAVPNTNINSISAQSVDANFNIQTKTQINLNDATQFAICDNVLYYLNSSTLTIFDTTSNIEIEKLNNVTNIEQTNSYVLVSTTTSFLIYFNNQKINPVGLPIITTSVYNAYEQNQTLYISYLQNNQLNHIQISGSQVTINIFSSVTLSNVVSIALTNTNTFVITDDGFQNTIHYFNNIDLSKSKTEVVRDNTTSFDVFEYMDLTYFSIVTNHNNLFLYTNNQNLTEVLSKDISIISNPSFSGGELISFYDINYLNNKLFILDQVNQNIQTFTLSLNDSTLSLNYDDLIVAKNSFEKGYFFNANDFYLNNNKIIISDSGNNRIQILNNTTNEISVLNNLNIPNLTNPKFVKTGDNYNLVLHSNNQIVTYNIMSNQVTSQIATSNGVSDLQISHDNKTYYLDYVNSALYQLVNNNASKVISNLNLDSNSKLAILNNGNFVITYNNFIYTYNNNFELVNTYNHDQNIVSISQDYYNNIYYLSSNGIFKLDTNYNKSALLSSINFSHLNYITIDSVTGTIYVFDSYNQKIATLNDTSFTTNLINYSNGFNVYDQQLLTTISNVATVNNKIYASNYPYNNNMFFELTKNSAVIVLTEVDGYYYTMFTNQGKIMYGYLSKSAVTLNSANTTQPKQAVVINKTINLYKYPTILKDGDNSFIYKSITLNTLVTVISDRLPSIDNSTYYAVLNEDNTIAYVNSSDIIISNINEIKPLPTPNANVISVDNKKINLYKEQNNQNIVLTLTNNQQIYVENFDVNKEYTYVTVITENREAISGYIETKYVSMPEPESLTAAFIVLGVSVTIIVILILTFIIKKKNQ